MSPTSNLFAPYRRSTRSSQRLSSSSEAGQSATQPTQSPQWTSTSPSYRTEEDLDLPIDPLIIGEPGQRDVVEADTIVVAAASEPQPVAAVHDSDGNAVLSDSSIDSDDAFEDDVWHADGSRTLLTADGSIHVPARFGIRPPQVIKVEGRTYDRTKRVYSRRLQRQRVSAVWAYGSCMTDRNDFKNIKWCCHACAKHGQYRLFNGTDGTSSIRKHLRKRHGIRFRGDRAIAEQRQIDANWSANGQTLTQQLISSFTFAKAAKEAFFIWIIMAHIALSQLENRYFRAFISSINNVAGDRLPSAASTLRDWIMDDFKDKKVRIIGELASARSPVSLRQYCMVLSRLLTLQISISFDGVTTSNHKSLYAVIAHYIDRNGGRRHTLLALRNPEGEHTGVVLAEMLLDVSRDFGITGKKVGWFIMDDAAVNGVVMDRVLRRVAPWLSHKQRKGRWIRCFGHITNLGAQAFIKTSSGGFDVVEDIDRAASAGDERRLRYIWERVGALGILHGFIRYVSWSPLRLMEFAKCLIGGDYTRIDKLKVS